MRKLFLDDFREPYQVGDYCYYKLRPLYRTEDWDVVRNFDEFTAHIRRWGVPDIISFDHDLADEHYDMYYKMSSGEIQEPEYTEKTGLDCARWLINYCKDNEVKLPETYVHSMNPWGKENITKLLENAEKHIR